MKVIKPSFKFEHGIDGITILKRIEKAGRTCYKSEDKMTSDSAKSFVKKIIDLGHESVLEHVSISVRVICDRGVSHEIVRHRIASYSQESTRYCNYANKKFGREVVFIRPLFWERNDKKFKIWLEAMKAAEKMYFELIDAGATAQEARSVLPNSLKTEIVMTMNLREWRHFFSLRTSPKAHPQMIEIAVPLLEGFKQKIPAIFDDI